MDGSYNITFDGKNVGKLKVQSQGLMTVFSGDTSHIDGLCRLAVLSEGRAVQIGVLSPADKGLHLKKSFTKNSLSELGIKSIEKVVVINGEESASEWVRESKPEELFSDPDLSEACTGAKGVISKRAGHITEAAFPVGSGIPFSLMPAFCLGKPAVINEKKYLIFKIVDGNLENQQSAI